MSEPRPDPSAAISIQEARQRKARQRGTTSYRPPDHPPSPGDLVGLDEPPPPPTDVWAPVMLIEDEYGYDDDQFFTQTSYGDEGTTQTRAAISKSMNYLMSMIVQSGKYPQVKTSADIVRDALVHWVHKRYAGLPPHIQQQALELRNRAAFLANLESRRMARTEIDRIIADTEQEFEMLRESGDTDEYKAFLKYVKAQRDTMRGVAKERLSEVIEGAEVNQ